MTFSICFELRANSAIQMWPHGMLQFSARFWVPRIPIKRCCYTRFHIHNNVLYRYVNWKSISKVAVRLIQWLSMVSGLMAVSFTSNWQN